MVFYIGLKAVDLLRKFTKSPKSKDFLIGVGRAATHARPSSERIQKAYINGLIGGGAKIINLGVTTTPDVYFACAYLLDSGINCVVNISASHNPMQDNGIKHCIVSKEGFIHSISADQLTEIKKNVVKGNSEKDISDKKVLKTIIDRKYENSLIDNSFSENTLSELHNNFVLAFGILGGEIIKALNLKSKRSFRKVLNTLSAENNSEGIREDILSLYKKDWSEILKNLKLPSKLPEPYSFKKDFLKDFIIVLDYANGSAHRTASIYRDLGALVVEVKEKRGFNPLESRNQENLKKVLKQKSLENPEKEVIGLAHDEDGDRLLVMRRDGIAIGGDRLLVINSMDLRSKDSDKIPLVITEVKSRPEVRIALNNFGVKCIIVPTGFAFIKDAAITIEKAINSYKKTGFPKTLKLYGQEINLNEVTPVYMWAELSGHFGFSQDLSYFFDDATLMAVNVLSGIYKKIAEGKKPGRILIEMDESFPSFPSSGELNVFVKTLDPHYVPSSEEKEELVNVFAKEFENHQMVEKIDRTDGIQVFFKDSAGEFLGWILIRKSNNEDKLVVVTSASNEHNLDLVETIFLVIARKVHTRCITGLVLTCKDSQSEERHPDYYIEERIRFLNP